MDKSNLVKLTEKSSEKPKQSWLKSFMLGKPGPRQKKIRSGSYSPKRRKRYEEQLKESTKY